MGGYIDNRIGARVASCFVKINTAISVKNSAYNVRCFVRIRRQQAGVKFSFKANRKIKILLEEVKNWTGIYDDVKHSVFFTEFQIAAHLESLKHKFLEMVCIVLLMQISTKTNLFSSTADPNPPVTHQRTKKFQNTNIVWRRQKAGNLF